MGQAVEAIERETSAEVVVTVRKCSGHYRQTDLFAGAAFALVMLAFLLFDSHPFDIGWMPVDVTIAFAVGAFVSAEVTSLRRTLTSPRLLQESTLTAARAAFYELGISRTTGRTGLLVYVSMFERRVVIVPDIAVKPDELGPEWAAAEQALAASVAKGPDFERFLTALGRVHAPLVRALPAKPDDVNELPDEPVMA